MNAQPDPLADRYGRASTTRRALLLGALGVLIAVSVGWLAWATWLHSTPQVTSELMTFQVVDEHRTQAQVQVQVDEGVTATCLLRAYAEDHTTVGELSFEVDSTGSHERSIRTERRATSVELDGCTTPEQSRPR